jgi:hypothetical protein
VKNEFQPLALVLARFDTWHNPDKMIPELPYIERWRLLTPSNIQIRRLWGWGHSIQKILGAAEPKPYETGQLLIASDYGGEHNSATHLIYCYLVVRSGGLKWLSAIRSARRQFLSDGRTMAYKRLGDPVRQRALVPFLTAAANLDAHLVAVAVDKKKWLSTVPNSIDDLRQIFGLRASWNPRSFEAMARKVHLTAILISIWSRPYTNVTWITDQDEFVANDARHDDALLAAARLSSMYLQHPMGVFRLNTTGQDPEASQYEDLCAIPDLAAGMLSEISTRLSKEGSWENRIRRIGSDLPVKAEIIADWFWDTEMCLRKTLIAIDVEGPRYAVRKVWTLPNEGPGDAASDGKSEMHSEEASVGLSRETRE